MKILNFRENKSNYTEEEQMKIIKSYRQDLVKSVGKVGNAIESVIDCLNDS